MKKLVLKKDIVARINNGEMQELKGGADTYNICQTILQATCTAAQTCEPNIGCGGGGNTGGYTGGGESPSKDCFLTYGAAHTCIFTCEVKCRD
ncbi:MAG: hypothetical protein HP046_07945 [Parabacteroides sp.]|nr:hypothetical protein [Parabacteroides sp.]